VSGLRSRRATRERIPLGLRGLDVGIAAAPVELFAEPSERAPHPPVSSAGGALAPAPLLAAGVLAPPAPTTTVGLDDGSVELAGADFRPVVDVAPETLRTATFAVRVEATALPAVEPPVAVPLFEPELRRVPPLPSPEVRREQPEAALVRRVAQTPPASLPREVLNRCLTALFRASGAQSPAELRLVGVYAQVPVGALDGVSLTDAGLAVLRLRPGAQPRPGLLVVGRWARDGVLVTVEVGPDGDPPQGRPPRRRH
jgi:hypothetical protein